MPSSSPEPPQLEELLKTDGYLVDFRNEICRRYGRVHGLPAEDRAVAVVLDQFTSSYSSHGLIVQKDNAVHGLEMGAWSRRTRSGRRLQ